MAKTVPQNKIQLSFDVLFSCTLNVRVADLNYGNHLGNDRILSYFHEGRVLWLSHHNLSEQNVGGCGLIMTGANIQYLQQARLHQVITLTLGARELGKARFTLVYKLTDDKTGLTIAVGETYMGFFDYQHQKPVRAPASFIALLHATPLQVVPALPN
jgi:acyl-CoA thioester hydrolase